MKPELRSGKYVLDPNSLGRFGEIIAKDLLREQGFIVEPFDSLLFRKKKCRHIEALHELCIKNCALIEGFRWCREPLIPCQESLWPYYEIWKNCRLYLSCFCPQVCKKLCLNRKILGIYEEVQGKYGASGPDFVASKEGETYLVEVKTGVREPHGGLKPSQKELAKRLEGQFGIRLLEMRIRLENELFYSAQLRTGSFSAIND